METKKKIRLFAIFQPKPKTENERLMQEIELFIAKLIPTQKKEMFHLLKNSNL